MENENKHRRSIRLPGYDYSQSGAYLITIVTHNRVCLVGSIMEGAMVLNDAGKMIDQVCQEIPKVLIGVELDHYQIMPNHFHGIIILNPEHNVGADLREALFELCLPWATTEGCPYKKFNWII